MFGRIKKAVVNDEELESSTLRMLSLLFLLIAGAMSFIEYTRVIEWWMDAEVMFQPGFISTIIAITLVCPLYVRGILKWNKSTYTIISLILILLVFGSFVELATGGDGDNSVVYALIGMAVVLSWLGIRAIAGVSWTLAFAAVIYSVIGNNYAMGFYGYVYISSAFIGLVLHSGLNPGNFYQGIKEEFSSPASVLSDRVKSDINSLV